MGSLELLVVPVVVPVVEPVAVPIVVPVAGPVVVPVAVEQVTFRILFIVQRSGSKGILTKISGGRLLLTKLFLYSVLCKCSRSSFVEDQVFAVCISRCELKKTFFTVTATM